MEMCPALFKEHGSDEYVEGAVAARAKPPCRARVKAPFVTGSNSAMISRARFLGAPVMEPPGKAKLQGCYLVDPFAQAPFHGRDQVEDLLEAVPV
jgi:hypothetical protein